MLFKRVSSALGLASILAMASTGVQAEPIVQALARAYANNPQIASALLNVKISAEGITQAGSGLRPNIAGSIGMNNSWTVAGGGVTAAHTGSIGVTYEQQLFDNYATDANVEAARAATDAQKYQFKVTEQDVLLNAANAYINVVRDTRLVELRADNVQFLRAQKDSAQDRFDVGEGTRTDVSQAEAQLAQAVSAYQAAVNTLQSTQASYQRWIGTKPQNLSLGFPFNNVLPDSLDAALTLAETQHPAIMASQAAVRAARAGVDGAQAAFGPSLSVRGGVTGNNNFVSGAQSVTTSLGLNLSIPIYSGGRLGSAERKANLQQIQSEVDALNIRDQLHAAVIAAWSGLQSAESQIGAVGAAEAATQLALNGVIESLNVGQSTTLDVLNARSSLTDIRINRINAETSKISAAFSLLSSIGRLDAETLGLPVNIVSADNYVDAAGDVWQELRSLPE